MTDLRAQIRHALDSMEQSQFDAVAMASGFSGEGQEFERIAREELAVSRHEVQVYWNGPCNCCGNLN